MKSVIGSVVAWFVILTPSVSLGVEELSLERREILDGRVSLAVPPEFQPAPEDEVRIKYPGANRPTVVLEDKSGSINIAFRLSDVPTTTRDIPAVSAALEASYKAKFPSARFVKVGPVEIDGYPFALIDVYTPAIDMEMRNMLVATSLDGGLLLVTFNYPTSQDAVWERIAKAVIASISIKNK